MDLAEFVQPLLFSTIQFDEALDNFDIADPHRRQDEFDDINTAPVVNAPLYDTSITTPIKKSNTSLTSFPDYSDEVMSDFRLAQMLGKPMEIPAVVDLDTADNYVDFIKNTIKNVIVSENEFNINNSEILEKSKV
jgi:hypothetical protein